VVLGRARAELYETVLPHLGNRRTVGVVAHHRRLEEAPRRHLNPVFPQIVV
jgi:hypothetical protein